MIEAASSTGGSESGLLLGLLVLGSPIIFGVILWADAAKGAVIFGVVAIYAGLILIAFLPLVGIVVSAALLVGGMLMVAIGAGVGAVLDAIDRRSRTIAENTRTTAEYFKWLKARQEAQQKAASQPGNPPKP